MNWTRRGLVLSIRQRKQIFFCLYLVEWLLIRCVGLEETIVQDGYDFVDEGCCKEICHELISEWWKKF